MTILYSVLWSLLIIGLVWCLFIGIMAWRHGKHERYLRTQATTRRMRAIPRRVARRWI